MVLTFLIMKYLLHSLALSLNLFMWRICSQSPLSYNVAPWALKCLAHFQSVKATSPERPFYIICLSHLAFLIDSNIYSPHPQQCLSHCQGSQTWTMPVSGCTKWILKNVLKLYFCFQWMGILPAQMSAPNLIQWLWELEESVWSSRTRVTDSCEPPRKCWESNGLHWKSNWWLLPIEPSFHQKCFCRAKLTVLTHTWI